MYTHTRTHIRTQVSTYIHIYTLYTSGVMLYAQVKFSCWLENKKKLLAAILMPLPAILSVRKKVLSFLLSDGGMYAGCNINLYIFMYIVELNKRILYR